MQFYVISRRSWLRKWHAYRLGLKLLRLYKLGPLAQSAVMQLSICNDKEIGWKCCSLSSSAVIRCCKKISNVNALLLGRPLKRRISSGEWKFFIQLLHPIQRTLLRGYESRHIMGVISSVLANTPIAMWSPHSAHFRTMSRLLLLDAVPYKTIIVSLRYVTHSFVFRSTETLLVTQNRKLEFNLRLCSWLKQTITDAA